MQAITEVRAHGIAIGWRQDCLEEKGWHIVRVWSTDWFDDPDGQTEKLVKQLEDLRLLAAERVERETARRAERALAVAAMIAEENASDAVGVYLEADPPVKAREEIAAAACSASDAEEPKLGLADEIKAAKTRWRRKR